MAMDVERQFERFVDGIGDTDAPREEHRRQLRKQVLAVVESAGTSGPTIPGLNTRRFIMSNALIRWFAAAAALLVCATLAWLHMGSSPAVAWAGVSESLNRAQTLSLKVAAYQGKELRTEEKLSCLNTDRMRAESKEYVVIMDRGQGKLLVLVPQGKHAYAGTLKDAEKWGTRDWLADLKRIVGNKVAKEIGDKTFENRPCKGWQVANSEGAVTVWADQKTAEIVRVEIEAGIVRTVMSDFEFNPKLDESQFSLDVPDGYKIVANTSFAAKDASEDDLMLLLRAWVGGNGDVFPDSLMDFAGWYKAASKYDWSKEKQDEGTMTKAISGAFFRLNAKQDWVYRGKGVKLGNSKQAIFWAPVKNGKYHVIYGDLSIRQVDKNELP
jgi:hypothetical protein